MRFAILSVTLLLALTALSSTAFADDIPDQSAGKVVKVESGEVIVVRLADSNETIKVRLLGIHCSASSRSSASKLVARSSVVLRSDKGFLPLLQDQHGRYVAYVQMKDDRDLGLELLKTGRCSTEEWGRPHPRGTEYASVEH